LTATTFVLYILFMQTTAVKMVTGWSALGTTWVATCPRCGATCAGWDESDLDEHGNLLCSCEGMETEMTALRVWVGCLSCFNNGHLAGGWFDPADGPRWTCPEGDPSHKEVAVMDSEGFASPKQLGDSPQAFADAAERQLEEMGEAEAAGVPWAAVVTYRDDVWDREELNFILENFRGTVESREVFAKGWASETADSGPIPEWWAAPWPFNHIDWPAAARDLFATDFTDTVNPEGGIFVWARS
jgi:hypothetical protein